jgi:hypothetical protein
MRQVTVGSERDGLAEIVKGVSAGERVITLGQYEIADGAAVRTASAARSAGGAGGQ